MPKFNPGDKIKIAESHLKRQPNLLKPWQNKIFQVVTCNQYSSEVVPLQNFYANGISFKNGQKTNIATKYFELVKNHKKMLELY